MPIEDIYLPEGDFENPLLQSQGYDLLKPTTGQALKAGLGLGQLEAPVNYLRDLDTYNNGPGVKLTPEAANKEYGIPGYLNFDRELAPEAARVMRERTLKRLSFDDVLNRASTAQNVGALGANFVGQMFDPINLATAFVPVTKIPGVSTMMTSLLTKNPFTQRAAIGAVEGTVGQALIEPIYIAGDQLGFDEHTNADVMRNLAFGTIFGAGAHVTLGAGADAAKFLYGKALSTHNVAVEKSILQLMDGNVVNVEPIIRADKNFAQEQAIINQLDQLEPTGRYGEGTAGTINYGDLPIGLNNRTPGDPIIRQESKLSKKELEQLSYLVHDKQHVIKLTKKGFSENKLLNKLLTNDSTFSGKNLYRGLYQQEIPSSIAVGEVVNLNKYASATEDIEVARQFSENNTSKLVVELENPLAYNYYQRMVSENNKLKNSDPEAYDDMDGDYINEVLLEEKEWIVPGGKYQITKIRTENNQQIATVKQISTGIKKEEVTGKPLTIPELIAASTKYSQMPSAAASTDIFVPPEATMFNPRVQPEIKPGQPVTNTELEQVIADLEFEAKSVLSKEELASINEANNASVKETDSYIGGLNQAFTCWKNG